MCICGVIIKFVVVHLNITDAFSFARCFHQLRFVSFCLASKFFFVLFSLRCACIAQILLLLRPNSVLSFEMSIVCIKYIRWFFVCFLVLCLAQLILCQFVGACLLLSQKIINRMYLPTFCLSPLKLDSIKIY